MPQDWVSIHKDRLAAIALGGNLPSDQGKPDVTIAAALNDISGDVGRIVAISRFYRTPAFPPGSGPDFVNAAALVATSLTPSAAIERLQGIEARFGRERDTRWGARTLDLDLLALGDRILPDPATLRHWIDLPPSRQRTEAPDRLVLPHPRLQDRAFVLIPLAEILPGWRHPLTGLSVAEMVAALPAAEKAVICPL